MSHWTDSLNALAYHKDLLREAEQRRLVRHVLEARPMHPALWRRVMGWLADRLSALGFQRQERRERRTAAPAWIERRAH